MNEPMKILIAYDGSSYADAAIDDLKLAGLPEKGEALVVSVSDISKSSSIGNAGEVGVLGKFVSTRLLEETIALTHRERARVRNEAVKLAIRGGRRLLSILPNWRLKNQVALGDPAEELMKKSDEFDPDLIVLGSRGRSAIGRFFLGSVSQQVAEKANSSVRVFRQIFENTHSPATNRIIIGASSLPDAEEVIRAVATRRWRENTEIRLHVVDDGISAGRISAVYPYAKAIFEQAVETLQATGARVSVNIKSGTTESVLLEKAEKWKAGSIFIANETAYQEKGLGALAANLITRAKCTVEIVR